jgi:glycosyltransferase involved in cell wall biosynthesis
MTFDVAIRTWDLLGILDREIGVYRQLASQGFQVTLVTFGGIEDLKYQEKFPDVEIVPLYHNRYRPNSLLLRILQSLTFPIANARVFQAGHLYRTHQLWGSWVLVVAKLFFRKPMVTRCGYELVAASRDAGASWARVILLKALSRIVFAYSDHIIVTSPRMSSEIQHQFNTKPEKVTIIGNSIELNKFYPRAISKRNGRVLFVGRLEKIKNIPLLLAAARSAKVAVDIVGTGREYDSIKSLVEELNIDCRFFGNVPNEDLVDYYNRCLVFVLPSHSEWHPKVLLEAMACGAPVIGTDVPGVRDIIEHGETGFLVGQDPTELANIILLIQQDKALANDMGMRASAFIGKEYERSRALECEMIVYKELFRKHQSHRRR